jgi:hypothetical protein
LEEATASIIKAEEEDDEAKCVKNGTHTSIYRYTGIFPWGIVAEV